MTDYIKQVAEAVRSAVYKGVWNCNGALAAFDVDIDAIIANVPKPEPEIWMRPDELEKAKVSPYLCHGWNERDKHTDAIPLYTYPPDALDEIYSLARQLNESRESNGRLIADAAGREAFIEELVKQRHAELIAVAKEAFSYGDESTHLTSVESIVAKIEQERGE